MELEVKINEGIKEATKSGNKLRLETLRSIRAAIIEFNKSGIGREMNEDDGIKILNNSAKKRRDAIELYEKGGRTELAEKEKSELEIIMEFLPARLSLDEIELTIKSIIAETGAVDLKDMGKVMGLAMKELAGKADGSEVQIIVRKLLNKD